MMQDNYKAGFSLIEIAIVLTIMGLLSGMAVPALLKYRQYGQFEVTRQRQEMILKSLATHLLVTHQVPCPANPAAKQSEFGFARLMCTAPTKYLVGIVPFRTLGLPESMAKDGFGRYFTYAIDPEVRNESLGFNDTQYAHVFNEFYCSRKGGRTGWERLSVRGDSGLSVFREGGEQGRDATHDFVVAVLVSHGPQGYGAFLADGNRSLGADMSVDEQVNADSTLLFVDRSFSTVEGRSFRHIVKWVSHKNLPALYGGVSCRK